MLGQRNIKIYETLCQLYDIWQFAEFYSVKFEGKFYEEFPPTHLPLSPPPFPYPLWCGWVEKIMHEKIKSSEILVFNRLYQACNSDAR